MPATGLKLEFYKLFLKDMFNLLITGSEGFIGKHLCNYLRPRFRVSGVDRKTGTEVSDIENISEFDAVIHLAAQTSVQNENIEAIMRDNMSAFMHIFDLCEKANKTFIFASSSCANNITSMYGMSKFFDEMYAQMRGFSKCTALRLHNVYGSDARPDTLMGKLLSSNDIHLNNNGNNNRHFTYIVDVCKAIEKSLFMPGGLYNVYNPDVNTTMQFTKEVGKYKSLSISLIAEQRKYDVETQGIDTTLKNLVDQDYFTIEAGIKQIFTT